MLKLALLLIILSYYIDYYAIYTFVGIIFMMYFYLFLFSVAHIICYRKIVLILYRRTLTSYVMFRNCMGLRNTVYHPLL